MWRPLTLLLLLTLANGAHAGERFRADLTARPGSDSNASGSAILEIDDSGSTIFFEIEYWGLESDEIASHIHSDDGSVEHLLPAGSPKTGVWENPPRAAFIGLRQGTLYILVHTRDYPDGEIAGDIVAAPVGVERESVGGVKSRF